MIKFTLTTAESMPQTRILYVVPEVISGFSLEEDYKNRCSVIMYGKEGKKWRLGNFPSVKIAQNFVVAVWNRISAADAFIIDLDEMRRDVSRG